MPILVRSQSSVWFTRIANLLSLIALALKTYFRNQQNAFVPNASPISVVKDKDVNTLEGAIYA
jgi:hypothetical protein